MILQGKALDQLLEEILNKLEKGIQLAPNVVLFPIETRGGKLIIPIIRLKW